MTTPLLDLDALDFDKANGLVTVVTVDDASGAVLMVAYADREALERTMASGEMHYLSRTRGPWHKGETRGNVQRVVALLADCDGDTVLAVVRPAGPACHTGTPSCFVGPDALPGVLGRLDALIEQRQAADTPSSSYVRALLDDRNRRLKKLGEEATELAIAAADNHRQGVIDEAADVLFHLLVVVRAAGADLGDVLGELVNREADRPPSAELS